MHRRCSGAIATVHVNECNRGILRQLSNGQTSVSIVPTRGGARMPSSMRWAVTLIVWSTPTLVFGCSCGGKGAGRPCPLMKDVSEVIFVGTVLAAENPPVSPESPESRTFEGQSGEARYTLQVEEAFSSSLPKQIDVYSGRGGGDCSVHLQVGEKYLVDGWDDRGWWNFPKDAGYFEFKHVAPGDYVLVYNPSNRTDERRKFPRTFYPASSDLAHAMRIHVDEGEWVKDVVVHVVAKSAQ
jgi:hypothetical protein